MSTADLKGSAGKLPAWSTDSLRASLQEHFDVFVDQVLTSTIEWYFRKRSRKKILGYMIRLAAITAAGAGAIIPLLAEMFGTPGGAPLFSPAWASVALIVGAGLVWIDRFLDATPGWLRYVDTALQTVTLRDQSILRWRSLIASWGSSEPTETQVQEALALLQELNAQAHAIVRDETKAWTTAFRSSLDQLDSVLKSRVDGEENGRSDARTATGS